MHKDLPLYFSAMKPTLPMVCRRCELRAPMFHLLIIRHTFVIFAAGLKLLICSWIILDGVIYSLIDRMVLIQVIQLHYFNLFF